jgi:hypothetical protein
MDAAPPGTERGVGATLGEEGKMLPRLSAKDDFHYGFRAGRTWPRLLAAALRLAGGLVAVSEEGRRLREGARRHLAVLRNFYPACEERIEGLSRALGREKEELLAASLVLGRLFGGGCTNFAALPPATSDGGIYVSWNLDLSPLFRLLIGRMPLFVRDIEGYKPYVAMGFPVLFGVGVMNGDGLCSVVNSVGCMDGGDGLTFFELNNLVMENCSTVEEVLETWRKSPRGVVPGLALSIILNANSIFADLGGEAVVIEHSHRHMAVGRAAERDGVIASANHYQFLDRELVGGADPVKEPLIAGSFARLARMYELLDLFHGRIEPRTIKMIVSDHGVNYRDLETFGAGRRWYEERVDDSTICCHPWNFHRHLLRLEFQEALVEVNVAKTLNSILLDPKRCTIMITPGNPCRRQYVPLWVGDVLRMEHADEVRGEIDYPQGMARLPRSGRRAWLFGRPHSRPPQETARSFLLRGAAFLDRVMSKGLVED